MYVVLVDGSLIPKADTSLSRLQAEDLRLHLEKSILTMPVDVCGPACAPYKEHDWVFMCLHADECADKFRSAMPVKLAEQRHRVLLNNVGPHEKPDLRNLLAAYYFDTCEPSGLKACTEMFPQNCCVNIGYQMRFPEKPRTAYWVSDVSPVWPLVLSYAAVFLELDVRVLGNIDKVTSDLRELSICSNISTRIRVSGVTGESTHITMMNAGTMYSQNKAVVCVVFTQVHADTRPAVKEGFTAAGVKGSNPSHVYSVKMGDTPSAWRKQMFDRINKLEKELLLSNEKQFDTCVYKVVKCTASVHSGVEWEDSVLKCNVADPVQISDGRRATVCFGVQEKQPQDLHVYAKLDRVSTQRVEPLRVLFSVLDTESELKDFQEIKQI
jgi:hypothetical protein